MRGSTLPEPRDASNSAMRLLPWRSSRPRRATSLGALPVGALALGALAIGATAVGALAIGAISIRRLRLLEGKLDPLQGDALSIGRLDLESQGPPGTGDPPVRSAHP